MNAIRYAGPGSTVTLGAEAGVLRIGDDGRGVEEEELSRLFERFYRSDRARASRGTGLGLAIVKHVVVSAGGMVEASGGPGRGLQVEFAASPPLRGLLQLGVNQGERLQRGLQDNLGNRIEEQLRPVRLSRGQGPAR